MSTGLHQADIAFLNEVKELQAAIGVFLGDRYDQAQIRFDHFLLGLTGFLFALLYGFDDSSEFRYVDAEIFADRFDLAQLLFDLVLRALKEFFPAAPRTLGDPFQPIGVEFVSFPGFDEVGTADSGLIGKPYHFRIDGNQTSVDTVQLVDEGFDAVIVQMQRTGQLDKFAAQGLIFRFARLAQHPTEPHRRLHPHFLKLGEFVILAGNACEGGQEFGTNGFLHGGNRQVRLLVRRLLGLIVAVRIVAFLLVLARLVPAAERPLKIDDIAQINIAFQQLVAPHIDRLEGQRTLAKPRNHRVAPGLNPLSNRDFPFPRQEVDGTHLAQIHPYRIVGPVEGTGLCLGNGNFSRGSRRRYCRRVALGGGPGLDFFAVGDIDAHIRQD